MCFDVALLCVCFIEFSSEFAKSVEDKQIAQQEAEQAKYLVLEAIQEKKSKIIHAEGESRAAKLIGEAIKANPGFAELRRIEAARQVAETLSRSHNKIYLNSDGLLVNMLTDFVRIDNVSK